MQLVAEKDNFLLSDTIGNTRTFFIIFLINTLLIFSLIIVGWKVAFITVFLLLALSLCAIKKLGYIYLLILISPIQVIGEYQLPLNVIRIFKWAVMSMAAFLVVFRMLFAGKRLSLPQTRLRKFMSLFIVWAIITTLFSVDKSASTLEFLRITSFFILFLLVFNTIEREEDIKSVIRMWIIGFVLISLLGIWQYFWGGEQRIHSVFRNANSLGEFCFFIAPLLWSLVICERRGSFKVIYYSFLCLWFLTIFLTGSRASWLASFIAIMLVGILSKSKKLLYCVLILTVFLIFTVGMFSGIKHELGDLIRLSSGLSYREFLWLPSLHLIKDHLFFGVGLGAIGSVLGEYSFGKIHFFSFHLDALYKGGDLHNAFLQVAAELGIVGLIIFLYFFKVSYTEIKSFLKEERNGSLRVIFIAGGSLIPAVFVHALFENTLVGSGSTSIFLWIFLGLLYSAAQIKTRQRREGSKISKELSNDSKERKK